MIDAATQGRLRRVLLALLYAAEPGTVPDPDVVEELLGHLEEGLRRHLVLGQSEATAMAAAVSDLGSLAAVRQVLGARQIAPGHGTPPLPAGILEATPAKAAQRRREWYGR